MGFLVFYMVFFNRVKVRQLEEEAKKITQWKLQENPMFVGPTYEHKSKDRIIIFVGIINVRGKNSYQVGHGKGSDIKSYRGEVAHRVYQHASKCHDAQLRR